VWEKSGGIEAMEIQVNFKQGVVVVTISGDMDTDAAGELDQVFRKLIRDGRVKLVVDLQGLAYTSSAGLRALVGGVREARQQGGDLRLAAVQPEVNKVLDLTGFTSVLKIYDDTLSAVASFEGS
jgi:anti-anti-sigma factor